jgi:hypothetical protein
MANQGFIIVKDGDKGRRASFRDFYGSLDKGAARPAFCYPKRKEELVEEIKSMKRAIENGHVAADKVMDLKMDLRKREGRLDKLNEEESAARKLFNENKDKWLERRTKLAEEISEATPTRGDKKKKVVNPHRVLMAEKSGLQEKKTEYIVISRLAGEESNVSFLVRD